MGIGVDTLRDEEVREVEEGGLREVVVSAGRDFCEEVMAGGAGGSIMLLIIRFWKSLYRS